MASLFCLTFPFSDVAVLWLKVGKQSRNCDYSQQAQHSPHSDPRCDDIVCGSAIFHYRLCERELSLTCSIKPQVPFRFINKEGNKNWRAEPLLELLPKDCTAESCSPLCTPSTDRGEPRCALQSCLTLSWKELHLTGGSEEDEEAIWCLLLSQSPQHAYTAGLFV